MQKLDIRGRFMITPNHRPKNWEQSKQKSFVKQFPILKLMGVQLEWLNLVRGSIYDHLIACKFSRPCEYSHIALTVNWEKDSQKWSLMYVFIFVIRANLFQVHSTPASNSALYYIYRAIFAQGLEHDGRNYEFLGASDSQWRSCTCVFFCTKGQGLPELPVSGTLSRSLSSVVIHCVLIILDVHKWMGDFSDIRIPSKCGARMGMCFTPSFPSIVLADDEWREESDPKFNGYIITSNSPTYSFTCFTWHDWWMWGNSNPSDEKDSRTCRTYQWLSTKCCSNASKPHLQWIVKY